MKKFIITLIVIVIVVLGIYFVIKTSSNQSTLPQGQNASTTTVSTTASTTTTTSQSSNETVIGTSVQGRDIVAYKYGTGTTTLLFVGGIHGGYEWNTSLVAYQLRDYLQANPSVIPANVQVTVIPVLNPDGLYKVVGTTTENFSAANVPTLADTIPGRFNANTVDLNRNFDCDWQSTGVWQNKTVSGGSAAFSEPESQAIENYITTHKPTAVVVWYSAAGGVYASSCHNGVLPETNTLTKTYATASGYPAYQSFDFYATTGDMVNWLAKENIPAISVLLTNHTDTEWTKNLAGIQALLNHYSK